MYEELVNQKRLRLCGLVHDCTAIPVKNLLARDKVLRTLNQSSR